MGQFKNGNHLGNKWKPAQSGNPHGRPKAFERFIEGSPLGVLYEVATKGNDPSARVSAAIAILDLAWGRVPDTVIVKIERARKK
jgi:hypothetical protein